MLAIRFEQVEWCQNLNREVELTAFEWFAGRLFLGVTAEQDDDSPADSVIMVG